MERARKDIELDPNFLNDLKKLKLDQKQKATIIQDIKNISLGKKGYKQLIGTMFPLKELKYLRWSIRIVFAETPISFVFLVAVRKKDWESRAYEDARKRFNVRGK